VAVLGGIVWFSINQANKGVVTVQTAKVAKVDSLVSQVTASGESEADNLHQYYRAGVWANHRDFGEEGDHIKKGDRLAAAGERASQRRCASSVGGNEFKRVWSTDGRGQLYAAKADLIQQQANLEKAKLDFDRGQGLYKDGLIPKQDFDQRKTAYDATVAAVDASRARMQNCRRRNWNRCVRILTEQGSAGAYQGCLQKRLTFRRLTGL